MKRALGFAAGFLAGLNVGLWFVALLDWKNHRPDSYFHDGGDLG